MTNQNDRFLKLPRNRSTWLYQRTIPVDIQQYYGGKKLITRSTKTERLSEARKLRDQWSEADTTFWEALRAGEDESNVRARYEAALVISNHMGIDFGEPITFGEALETDRIDQWEATNERLRQQVPLGVGSKEREQALGARLKIKSLAAGRVKQPVENIEAARDRWYSQVIAHEWQGKSPEQRRNHKIPIFRAVKNFKNVIKNDDLEFLATDRKTALKFYDWLDERVKREEISRSTARRDMGVLRRMWKGLAHRDQVLAQNPFEGLTWEEPKGNQVGSKKKKRKPFSRDWLVSEFTTKPSLAKLNEEARAIIYILIETGARPSEIVNLQPENIYLNSNIPHFHVRAMEGREIKTASSDRKVPLVGIALVAMRNFPNGFPRYYDKDSGFSKVAMDYLRSNELRECEDNYVYSFRHSYIDRMRECGVARDLRQSIVGHDEGDSHGGYGEGYSLEKKLELMEAIALPFKENVLK